MVYARENKVLICVYASLLTCVIFIETKKPYSKRQQAIWRLECDLGVINDPDCPVDGAWAPWSSWSPCHGSCDDVGHRKRTRECINPPPSQDGLSCSGPDEETKSCFLTNCTVKDFEKLVRGDSVRLDAFRQLEAVPALMERCLQMECPFKAIEVSLAADNIWRINPEALWNSLQCVKHNTGCPVTGGWGAWGAWSTCGAQCGRGLRWRLRRCDSPPPSAFHLVCLGRPLQSEECEGDHCAIDDPLKEPIGAWGDWGPWSSCSENCGTGFRRRRRPCNKKHMLPVFGTWGTHCRGQHDQLEVCERESCTLDGGWSGWSFWGPCSQSCGAGKRSRIRSCTRPMPAGTGLGCVGPRTEVGSCHLTPCQVYSHKVAVLNGESFLHYNFEKKHSVLFHFYVRFLPLSPHGTLVRRGTPQNPQVRLSLQKWHVCLDANGLSRSCGLPRICSRGIVEPAAWHNALVTVTSEIATLRIDDEPVAIKSTFPCDPELPDNPMNIMVGEKLHGEIQEVILNFIPLKMIIDKRQTNYWKSDFYPSSASNIAYDNTNLEEAYLILNHEEYLRIPCFSEQDEWQLELTLKPKKESGTVLFLQDDRNDNWLYLVQQNNRLKLKMAIHNFRSERSSIEYPLDQWLDIAVSKKKDTNTVDVSINSEEHLHISLVDEISRKRRDTEKTLFVSFILSTSNPVDDISPQNSHTPVSFSICADEFYIGGVPQDVQLHIPEEFIPFSGVIASLRINNVLQDLHSFNVERYKGDKMQVSSKTASVSGSYHETAWGESNRLNLTCLHARIARSPNTAHWLFLDTTVNSTFKHKTVRSVDDGKVLRLVASGDNDLKGFYTCRAHSHKKTRNIVTYGVLGKMQYKLSDPDSITVIAVITTLILVVSTLGWLFVEGINDLRNGYGFFRDAHFSPEEEADAVCKYIDNNLHLYSDKSIANIAKARARRRGKKLASRMNFSAQEPQGLMQEKSLEEDGLSLSEPESLPALPEVKSSVNTVQHVLRCEPCYISSPRHGSNITSPQAKFTSSSSCDGIPPKVLCSRLLFAKRKHTSKESLVSKTSKSGRNTGSRRERSMLTVKSSAALDNSPAHKILEKFYKLQNYD